MGGKQMKSQETPHFNYSQNSSYGFTDFENLYEIARVPSGHINNPA